MVPMGDASSIVQSLRRENGERARSQLRLKSATKYGA
jgi:hypothetical protein